VTTNSPTNGSSVEGVAFVVDLQTGDTTTMEEVSLASVGLKEREDLQRWIAKHPGVVGDGLILITSEFDRWEVKEQSGSRHIDDQTPC
jgi:hypothetical protein